MTDVSMQPTLVTATQVAPGTTATPPTTITPADPNAGASNVVPPTQGELDLLPAAPDWAKDWTDDDRKLWGTSGKLDPNGVWKSWVNANKLISSSQRVALPKEGDEASVKAFNKAIGVPDDATGYKIEVPEQGGDPVLAKEFGAIAHKAGLTPRQVTELNKFWNDYSAKAIAAQAGTSAADFQKNADVAVSQLKSEWGAEYSTNFNSAVRALTALGVSAEQALKIEDAMGTKAMITAFSKLGSQIGDGKFVSNGTMPASAAGINSAESATTWINEIKMDSKRMDQLSQDMRNPGVTSVDKTRWQRAHEVLAQIGQR